VTALRRDVQLVVGVVLVLVGLMIGGDIAWFYYHAHVDGTRLVHQEQHMIAVAGHRRPPSGGSPSSCAPYSDSATAPQGLVEARSIGMTAPVVGGDASPQLAVAVGHVPGSAWPGEPGTTVLAAHDVTYFSDIGQLVDGSVVDFATPCATYIYRVSGHQIVETGSPVYSSATEQELVLETCYPENALYLTDKRYLVTANLVSRVPAGRRIPPVAPPVAPSVPAPPALAAQGLTLATNDAELGTLTITGSPARSWEQSVAPYDDEAAVLAEYFGAIRSAEQGEPQWWAALAPGVTIGAAAPLGGATISAYEVALDVTLDAAGSTFDGAALEGHVMVTGGTRPGEYAVQVTETVVDGALRVQGWTMTPL
jgi:sortase A